MSLSAHPVMGKEILSTLFHLYMILILEIIVAAWMFYAITSVAIGLIQIGLSLLAALASWALFILAKALDLLVELWRIAFCRE